MSIAKAILTTALLSVAGCSGTGGVQDEQNVSQYDCGDFGKATFRVTGNESAELVLGVTRYPLTRERTASGARYAGPGVTFWSRSSEAMLVVEQQTGHCSRVESG